VTNVVAIVGLVQSLFGILIFITKRPKHLSFLFLVMWLAVMATFLGGILLPFHITEYFKPGLFPAIFLVGPLLFFYVSSLTVEEFRLRPKHILHIIPMTIIMVHRSIVNSVPMSTPFIYNEVYYSLLVMSLALYWFLSLKLILKHRKNVPFHFSNYTQKNSLTWLIFVLSAFFIFFVVHFFVSSIHRIWGVDLIRTPAFHINFTIFTFIMIFFGINQSAIYRPEKRGDKNSLPSNGFNNEGVKLPQSTLNKKQVEKLYDEVYSYLEKRKPYLNPDFSLQMMSDDLNISRQKLSMVINFSRQKNFYKLINEFRVAEVKEKLADSTYNHYSVLGIGLESGFNSKTSFNRIFKEETGLTPTEYKRSI